MRSNLRHSSPPSAFAPSSSLSKPRFNATELLIYVIFVISAIGPIARFVPLGPFTLSGFFTLFFPILVCAFILFKGQVKRSSFAFALPVFILMFFVAGWDIVNLALNSYVFQNTAFALFGLATSLILPSILNYPLNGEVIYRAIKRTTYLYLVILTVVTIVMEQEPAITQLGVLFFSFHIIAFLKTGSKLSAVIALVIFLETLLLNSRIITLAEFLIFSLALFTFALRKPLLILFLFVSVLGTSVWFVNSSLFIEGMTGGDNALAINGIEINTSGRFYYWKIIFENARNYVWFGNGHSVPDLVRSVKNWKHPHNDYLRFLHQTGAVGLSLWFFFVYKVVKLKRKVLTNLRNLPPSAQVFKNQDLILTAFYYFVGVSIMMLTDNTIVYSYVTYPLGLLLGLLPIFSRIR